jgi:hypothetical protein
MKTTKGRRVPYDEYPPDHYIQPLTRNQQPVYLCDIDGTLTRRDEDNLEVSNTRGIHDYERVSEDLYHPEVFDTVAALQQSGAKIIFVSGRPDSCRNDSVAWLNAPESLKCDHDNPLYMRKTGDRRPDTIVKRELFDNLIRPCGYRILGVFDDRNRVVRMWRDQLGLTVFHVADHNF